MSVTISGNEIQLTLHDNALGVSVVGQQGPAGPPVPTGTATRVLFSDGTAVDTDADFVYDKTANTLTVNGAIGFASDTMLRRGAAGVIEQYNGANQQGYRFYSNRIDAANYTRGFIGFSGGEFMLVGQNAGTGGAPSVGIYAGTNLNLGAGGFVTRWQMDLNGHLRPFATNGVLDIGSDGARVATGYFGNLNLKANAGVTGITLAPPDAGAYSALTLQGNGGSTTAGGVLTGGDGGLYLDANEFRWRSAALASRMTLASSGNLLLATTNDTQWDGTSGLAIGGANPAIKFHSSNAVPVYLNHLNGINGDMNWYNSTSDRTIMSLTPGGNLALGLIPYSWSTSFRAIDLESYAAFYSTTSTGSSGMTNNAYVNGAGVWVRKWGGHAALYQQAVQDGSHTWFSAGNGVSDSTVSWLAVMRLGENSLKLYPTVEQFFYNVDVDALNWERAEHSWLSNEYRIRTAKAGTGTLRGMRIEAQYIDFATGGTGAKWELQSDGGLTPLAPGVYGIGTESNYAGVVWASAIAVKGPSSSINIYRRDGTPGGWSLYSSAGDLQFYGPTGDVAALTGTGGLTLAGGLSVAGNPVIGTGASNPKLVFGTLGNTRAGIRCPSSDPTTLDVVVADESAWATLRAGSIQAVNGNITSTFGGIGYGTGAGGTVTQLTNKNTGVTLNKATGVITMASGSIAASGVASFILTNSTIAATDHILVSVQGGGTGAGYLCTTVAAAGSCTVHVRNVSGGALDEAVQLRFTVIKSVNS